MALGNKGFSNGGPLVFLNPRRKDKEGNEVKPHFAVARVVDEKIEQTEETFSTVSGDLVRVEVKEKTFNQSVLKEAVLYLRDNDANETYRLTTTFSMSSRGLFNSMASLKAYNNVSIDIYENKKGFEAYSLKQDGEKVSWKYELAQLPAPEEIKDKKGALVKRDFGDLDAFFEKELLAIAAVINKTSTNSAVGAKTATSATSTATSVTNETKTSAATPEEDDSESVPF